MNPDQIGGGARATLQSEASKIWGHVLPQAPWHGPPILREQHYYNITILNVIYCKLFLLTD